MAPTEIALQDVARAIQALCHEFMEGVAAKNAARITVLYTDDARTPMPGRPAIAGKSAILDFWQASLDEPVEQICPVGGSELL
jgi:uncharacterized protein (TIGR02246 family)